MNEAPQTIETNDAATNDQIDAILQNTPQQEDGNQRLIPLNLLSVSIDNVRKLKPTAIAELAANIRAYGLLQNLVVTPTDDGYAIVAGSRRYLALNYNVRNKHIEPDYPVPCKVVAADNLTALSLAENDQREAMHPSDEFMAWNKLHKSGLSIEEISDNNGVSPIVIKRRLRLANASPKLFKLYRKGEITLEVLMAFCATDDRKKQEAVFEELQHYALHPETIRRHLSDNAVAGNFPIALFVGLTDYQEAGGTITTDLFANQEDPGAITFDNEAILERLFAEKAKATEAEYIAQGWKWATLAVDRTVTHRMSHRLSPTRRKPSASEKKAIETQAELVRTLAQKLEDEEQTDEEYEAAEAAYNVALIEANRLDDALDKYSKKQMAVSGVVLGLTEHGQISPRYGWVKAEDEVAARALNTPKRKASDDDTDNDGPNEDNQSDETTDTQDDSNNTNGIAYSDPLCQRLSAWRTVGLRHALTNSPAIAKRFAIIALAQSIGLIDYCHRTDAVDALNVWATCPREPAEFAPDLIDSKLYKQMNAVQGEWQETFASLSREETLASIFGLSDEKADELLAFIVGLSVDAITNKTIPEDRQPGKEMVNALQLQMAEYWQPTAESYFLHLTRAQIAEAVKAFAPDKLETLKGLNKRDTARAAESLVSGTGWMPVFMQS